MFHEQQSGAGQALVDLGGKGSCTPLSRLFFRRAFFLKRPPMRMKLFFVNQDRQLNRKGAAFALVTLYLDSSIHGLNQLFGKREAYAVAPCELG